MINQLNTGKVPIHNGIKKIKMMMMMMMIMSLTLYGGLETAR